MKTKIIIGIDPDVKKSGVAINDKNTGIVSASSFCFPELLDFLKDVSTRFDATIYVEASWLIKKSTKKDTQRVGRKKRHKNATIKSISTK